MKNKHGLVSCSKPLKGLMIDDQGGGKKLAGIFKRQENTEENPHRRFF